MARAKKDVTDPRVQGHRLDPLDRLIVLAANVAAREGLLGPTVEAAAAEKAESGDLSAPGRTA